jgi:hypothetical protein
MMSFIRPRWRKPAWTVLAGAVFAAAWVIRGGPGVRLLGVGRRRRRRGGAGRVPCRRAATAAQPAVLVAGHLSTEPGARRALAALGLRPLLDLGLRLGEGTGAALALPIVESAARVLRDLATFDSAGVSGAKE